MKAYSGKLSIYNNDGPGICEEMADKEAFEKIKGKIIRIVPRFCVIGKLFEPDVPAVIIRSSGTGLLQHDIMTWQIEGDQLCTAESQDEESMVYNDIFGHWIESASREQREAFTRDFFDALGAGGAATIPQVAEGGLDGFGTILLSIAESESRTKIVIGKFIRSFLERMRQVNLKEFLRSKDGIRSGLFILAGLVFFLAPELAVQSIGTVVAVIGFLWSAGKLIDCAMETDSDRERKKKRLIVIPRIRKVLIMGSIWKQAAKSREREEQSFPSETGRSFCIRTVSGKMYT